MQQTKNNGTMKIMWNKGWDKYHFITSSSHEFSLQMSKEANFVIEINDKIVLYQPEATPTDIQSNIALFIYESYVLANCFHLCE